MASLDDQLATVSAVLLEDRILRRVIKRHRRLHGVGLQVPHATSYTLARADLVRLTERDELPLDPAALPDPVVLFTAPREPLVAGDAEALTGAWRLIFHARIHAAFDALFARGGLTTAVIRERINRIGQTEFDEIRFVLRQEDLLLPPADDATAYVEFAALYLELAAFAPATLARTFPALADTGAIAATLALDLPSALPRGSAARPGEAGACEVDTTALLALARPPGAPERPTIADAEATPQLHRTTPAPDRPVVDPAARGRANVAREKGNRARAAILDLRAGDDDAARRDLDELCVRLSRALPGADTTGWTDALLPVARHAAGQTVLRFEPGARLLYDLQAACVHAQREENIVDLVGWALARGKRPVVRALPAAREVRIAKRVHAAADKIADVELASADERAALATAIHAMVEHAETNVRAKLRPEIERALDSVGLTARGLPEKVAQKKVVDELLDHAVASGRLSIGVLRDALSHNDLKMDDLATRQLVDGDQLLRLDRALSRSLDGVYQRGEAYLRVLQKLSSVFFGTPIGRFASKFVLLPLLGAYAALEGAKHLVGAFAKYVLDAEEPDIATPASILGLAVFLFGLLYVPPFRRGVVLVLRGVWIALRFVLWRVPRGFLRIPAVQRLRDSLVGRWVIRPAIPAAIAYAISPQRLEWPLAGVVFANAAFTINSRLGRRVGEDISDWTVRSTRQLTQHLAPNLFHLIVDVFSRTAEVLDRGIYRVDQWLRFRQGQSKLALIAKGTLATVWFFVTYLLRLYINLFVEPVINPIKHFPTVTVAAKLTWPFSPAMIRALSAALGGSALADGFAAFTVFVLPGLAGFLVWELKENWKLYKASRPKALRSVAIGHHGETMGRFLRPGIHSGTIPKAFLKLRRAAWHRDEAGVAKHKEGLHHVEEAIHKFADRELVSILVESSFAGDLAVAAVDIASNRVTVELSCASAGAGVVAIGFDEQSGWLVAGLRGTGWLAALDPRRRAIFELALAGFYRLAGVELVREQLEAVLACATYDIADDGLLLWPDGDYSSEIVYDLASRAIAPTVRGREPRGPVPSFAGKHALFGRESLALAQWDIAWQRVAAGEVPPRVAVGPSLLGEVAMPEQTAAA